MQDLHTEHIAKKEKYILVAVSRGNEDAAWSSLEELAELVSTAGGETCAMVVQNLERFDRATYVGSGKAKELKEMIAIHEADGIVCDDELSPSQFRNLGDVIECKVIDRTLLILDIFAAHARTREGKIQVEIAQLRHRASRLTGMGEAMSRLGAGIGTRGPGETKLETDRRVIQKRIKLLSDEIEDMKRARDTSRKKRQESSTKTIAIVGYTNAGKSTLLNLLTQADVLSENKLFATLDPTTRIATLESGQDILLTDTVGFINKLPHHLVDAFRSTLEEAKYADVIMHVIDASNPQHSLHYEVVNKTLEDLGVVGKPMITVWNKIDTFDECEDEKPVFTDFEADACCEVSARTGKGIDKLLSEIERILNEGRIYVDTIISYQNTSDLNLIRKYGQLLSEEYAGEGIHIKAYVPYSLAHLAGKKGND